MTAINHGNSKQTPVHSTHRSWASGKSIHLRHAGNVGDRRIFSSACCYDSSPPVGKTVIHQLTQLRPGAQSLAVDHQQSTYMQTLHAVAYFLFDLFCVLYVVHIGFIRTIHGTCK
jgi:hypothetical protein